MRDSLFYKLHSGKPSKLTFLLKGYFQRFIPNFLWQRRYSKLLRDFETRADKDYILSRVDYYNQLEIPVTLPKEEMKELRHGYYIFLNKIECFRPSTFHKVYYFDLQAVMHYFSNALRIGYIPGDVYFTPEFPALVKSRLLKRDNVNSVILKLDKLRHFMFVKDSLSFKEKKNQVIFRGKIRSSRLRTKFLELYFGTPLCDCGVVGKNEGCPEEWMKPKKTIREHLDYKFIMAIEGNDVASNLKWVMSSNSIAVMPRPTCETWFMEGTLQPDYHYIEVKDDFSDLEEKLNYYIAHPDKAEEIIRHAHEYVAQFQDKRREEIISVLVAEKYFRMTNQNY